MGRLSAEDREHVVDRDLLPLLGMDISWQRPAKDVAPGELASTFVTSVAGVVTFTSPSARHNGTVAPLAHRHRAWYRRPGGRLQKCPHPGARLPDVLIRRAMGILVAAIGARYLWSGLG